MTYLNKALESVNPGKVVIVGSGPGGLVAAKYLKEHGFEPVIFEQAKQIGGQWNVHGPGSGVWPSMVYVPSSALHRTKAGGRYSKRRPGFHRFGALSGEVTPTEIEGQKMQEDVLASRSEIRGSPKLAMHKMALLFSREAGLEPDLIQHPKPARALLFSPLTAVSFRLSGPDGMPEAASRITTEAQALRTVVSPPFSTEELTKLQAPALARDDSQFTDFVTRVNHRENREPSEH